MMTLEDAILTAVKDCNRNGVRATATTVLPRLPETMTYSPDWIKVILSNMAARGKLVKIGRRKGYKTANVCLCCNRPLESAEAHLALAN